MRRKLLSVPPEDARAAILKAALPHVPFDGWSDETLTTATKEAGFEAEMGLRAFPKGGRGLIEEFIADADRRMVAELEKRDLAEMKIREKIATAVRIRLVQNKDHKDAIRRAIGVRSRGPDAVAAGLSVFKTVDVMWRAIGDQSTDFNFYTKRGLLAGVYGATLLYWLDDESEGQQDTWEFLDRRIGDIMKIQKLRGRFEKACTQIPNPREFFKRSPFGASRRRDQKTPHPGA
jgi:ubiquinone biosynthesis protein COQ9